MAMTESQIQSILGTAVAASAANASVNIGGFEDGKKYVKLPEPSSYEAMTATIVKEVRNSDGEISFTVVKDDAAKITLEWSILSGATWGAILSIFSGKLRFVRPVKFINQTDNDFATRMMYVSDRTAEIHSRKVVNGEVRIIYKNCKLELIDTRKKQ